MIASALRDTGLYRGRYITKGAMIAEVWVLMAAQSREFISLLYLFFTLRDHLTYDFVAVSAKWSAGQLTVSNADFRGALLSGAILRCGNGNQ